MAGLTRCGYISLSLRSSLLSRQILLKDIAASQSRGKKVWVRPVQKSLYWRRLKQGPEPERPRRDWINWNYDSEIFSFGKRLGEEFNPSTLRVAFTDQSFIEKEKLKWKDLELNDEGEDIDIPDNTELGQKGEDLALDYIRGYLRAHYPALPEEGISAISNTLMTQDTLAYVGNNLGVKELILCDDYPPSEEVTAKVFKAVIGALVEDQGSERAKTFVQDFILTQLIGKNMSELWDVVDPMGLLVGVLTKFGRGEPEPRLLFQTGSETIEAAYMVGVYSDKELIGKGYGETVTIAEEMAARNALERFFGTQDTRLRFGEEGHNVEIDTNAKNASVLDYQRLTEQKSLH